MFPSEMIIRTVNQADCLAFVFGSPGPQEMLIVGIIALLLFGKRLPEVARNLGRGFSEFKKGMTGFQDEIRSASREADRAISYKADSNSSSSESRPAPPVEDTAGKDDFTAPRFEID